jgi:hypothetical protein
MNVLVTLRLAFTAPVLLMAACTVMPMYSDLPICSTHTVCFAEDVPKANLASIKGNGNSLNVRCPYSISISALYRSQCQASVAGAISSLSRWPDQLSVPAAADVSLQEQHTCIDTFIPGREAADCEYYFLEATVPLRWH